MEVVICHLLSEEAQSSGCQVWWSVLRCWLLMRTDHSGTTKWGPRPRRNFFFLSFFKSPLLPFIVDCCLEAVQINRLYWSWLGWERRSVMDRHCMISSFCRPSDTSCWLSFKQILAPPSCQRTKPTDCIWDYDDISAIDRHLWTKPPASLTQRSSAVVWRCTCIWVKLRLYSEKWVTLTLSF